MKEIVFTDFEFLHESVFAYCMFLDGAIFQDMVYRQTGIAGEMPANQDHAMAEDRVFLRAHHGDSVLLHTIFKSFNAFGERCRGGETSIDDPFVLVTCRIGTARAEFFPEINIVNTSFAKRILYLLAVKLRGHNAIRIRPNIGNGRNMVCRQHIQEILAQMV